MNCVLFAKMDQVFSKENKALKKYWKIGKKYWKSQGKVREFCQSGKVGTLIKMVYIVHISVYTHIVNKLRKVQVSNLPCLLCFSEYFFSTFFVSLPNFVWVGRGPRCKRLDHHVRIWINNS